MCCNSRGGGGGVVGSVCGCLQLARQVVSRRCHCSEGQALIEAARSTSGVGAVKCQDGFCGRETLGRKKELPKAGNETSVH